ncbi:hypothetical protein DER46DRAFT_654897 [Fusarium sp. MPI-SDFR-AT-0072]|nr:hypothetical protein DER46DRAFT_654897 [Fusarium sp. MPI-SDFR-AT-0072]
MLVTLTFTKKEKIFVMIYIVALWFHLPHWLTDLDPKAPGFSQNVKPLEARLIIAISDIRLTSVFPTLDLLQFTLPSEKAYLELPHNDIIIIVVIFQSSPVHWIDWMS